VALPLPNNTYLIESFVRRGRVPAARSTLGSRRAGYIDSREKRKAGYPSDSIPSYSGISFEKKNLPNVGSEVQNRRRMSAACTGQS
jgi:hypothetical protein